MKYLKSFPHTDNLNKIIDKYIEDTKFDIENTIGNCAHFAKDFYLWAQKNQLNPKLVYLQQDYNKSSDEIEDHIVPAIDNNLIDFTLTSEGPSKIARLKNSETLNKQINPTITPIDKILDVYDKWGYINWKFIDFSDAFIGVDAICQTIESPKFK